MRWLKAIMRRDPRASENDESAAALYSRGLEALKADRAKEALEALRAGHALEPEHLEMHYRLALALMALEDYEAALAELEALHRKAPRMPQVLWSLGYLYRNLGRIADGLDAYRRVLELVPTHADARSNLLLTLNYSAAHTRDEVFAEHRRFGALHVQPAAPPRANAEWPRRLRIGYVSPDFRSHVVSCFLWPILTRHDRDRFEVYCYFTHHRADAVTSRLRDLADRWADCARLSDRDIAERIRGDGIDILVDLAGHTADQRLAVFARRPAPVQVTYLGYPNTTGVPAIGYRITDAAADPPGDAERFHVERLVRLPRTFLCYRPGPDVHAVQPPPSQRLGWITFGCFSNFQKLSPPFFDAAAKLLRAVPDSRLLLKAKPLAYRQVAAAVRERFARAGIDDSRVILRGWEPSPEAHLALYHEVDIALDSFPYNGTTTTCEAAWMGVPVVTLRGDRHAARVGASLLGALGLEELIAQDSADLVRIAARLAGERGRLTELRAGMRARLQASALMDEAGFVRELEEAYLSMWAQARAPKPAAHLDLAAARELRRNGDAQGAKLACQRLLEAAPDREEAAELLWELCNDTQDPSTAIEALGPALAERPASARLHYMLGCSLEDLGRWDEAAVAYRAALERDPLMAKASNNLGCVLEAKGELDEAERRYRDSARADPRLGPALFNLANRKKQRAAYAEAAELFGRAVQADPARPDWHCALAETQLAQWQLDASLESYGAALALDKEYAPALAGLANALVAAGRVEEAERAFEQALRLRPDDAVTHSNLLLCLHYRHGDDPARLHRAHLEWAARHVGGVTAIASAGSRAPSRPLHVGYVSPNLHQHSVAFFLEPLLRAHDAQVVRAFCYSNVRHADAVTQRLRGVCRDWRECVALDDDQLARQARADRIDVLVDLAGHTGGGRLGVFARKPAPVQVAWLGYPGTSGLAAIDYRLTDTLADPEGSGEAYYTENLIRLPAPFLCYLPPADSPPVAKRNGVITFGSFNHLPKLTPPTIELWARLLHALPVARLVVKAQALGEPGVRQDIAARFAGRGVGPERLTLLGREASVGAHLARYGEIDIALDTYPYNGTTTTCEALWMGVPVVSYAGATHVSRVGASILSAVGLSELVASSPEDFLHKALELARDGPRLRELRAGLRGRLRASPLLDAARFARAVEAAYLGLLSRKELHRP